jgi:116 kDa U5 small nuclear ribonucleoprotein component
VINKVDRLILELKLPPQDAYFKLLHTLEEVNTLIATHTVPGEKKYRLSPELGNVCFASAVHGWSFSLQSFASLYLQRYPTATQDFAKRLWGDWFVNETTHAITKRKAGISVQGPRTFVQFVLEPLYKLYAHVLGESPEDLVTLFHPLGIRLSSAEAQLDPQPLLRLTLRRFFGVEPRGVVSMLATCTPSPIDQAEGKVRTEYGGRQDSVRARAMQRCLVVPERGAATMEREHGTGNERDRVPVTAHVVKLLNTSDGTSFLAMTRIYSGILTVGQRVQLLGEAFTAEDDEDRAFVEVTAIHVSVGRFTMEVSSASAGNVVLLAGIDGPIKKSATLCDTYTTSSFRQNHHHNDDGEEDGELATFRPLSASFDNRAVIKLAIEPQIPSELPKMVEALRRLNKSYPLLTTKVEESGEHILLGTGELYLDCALHDLRHLYSDIEVKVADPVVVFQETCVDSSSINCHAETPNKKNALTMLAEPLDDGLARQIETHCVAAPRPGDDSARLKEISAFFTEHHHWDLLTARSVWAFGPDDDAPNVLVNNTLPSEVSQSLLFSVRESVVQGFKWGTREGPLCDEAIRNVKFRLLDVSLCKDAIHRGGGQVIPTARRSVYASFLLATPRLMEPMMLVELQAPADCVQAIYPVLARRRGHIVQDAPKPGAPFYTVKAFLPAMDSFGFETDLRSYTMGQVSDAH